MKATEYELLVREIYQQILDQDQAPNIRVEHNVQKRGRVTTHQIDVYWQFKRGGVTHEVIVQAKRWKNSVRKSDVLAFKGVLEDLPGARGIMVTTSGYQRGAREVAEDARIMICNLNEDLSPSPVSMYPGETATFSIKGALAARDGTHLGMLVEVTRKVPKVSDVVFKADSEWHRINHPLPPHFKLEDIPLPIRFCDPDGNESITLQRIFAEFYAEMHRTGEMESRKTFTFEKPTYLELSDPPRKIKEESVSAKVVFEPEVKMVEFKAPNVATFVLSNIADGADQRFLVPKI